MADADLFFKPAIEVANDIRSGEVSAREVTEFALRRIEQLDPKIGAFMHVDADRALAAADAIKPGDERPFAGVPTAIKDIVVMLEGAPYTSGSEIFGDFIPDFDSAVVSKIKNAGFVIVGKTKTPEMGIVPTTEPRRYGPSRNPYDLTRTPGGSSGGSAAAVAAGVLPIAHGNDGGGSLRIPGACCGLIGFKMSRGRVSYAPLLGDSFLNMEGMLSRSVADVAAAADVITGYEPGDATWAPPPSAPFAEAVKRDPGKMKIGFTVTPPIDVPVDPAHVEAVHDTAKLLESLGHDVEEATIPWKDPGIFVLFTKLYSIQIASLTNFGAQVTGREVTPELVEPLTWEFYEHAKQITGLETAMVDTALKAFARINIAATYGYDAILCPTLCQRPVPLGTINTEEGMDAFRKSAEFTSFTAGINVTGQPAMSVPTGLGDDGLPTAVQIIGRPAADESLLSLAAQIEQARPWAHLRPEL
jgi:amidase